MTNLVPSSLTSPASGPHPLQPTTGLVSPVSNVFQVELQTEVHQSIRQIPAATWNGLVPRDEPQLRHDLLLALEVSGSAKAPRYAAVSRAGHLVGVAISYEVDIDLLLLASPKLQGFAERIRRGPLRRLGILRSRSCGPVVTNCRANVYLDPTLSPTEREAVASKLVQSVDELPGGSLRTFFEHDEESVAQLGTALEAQGYVRAASLPGTRLKIEWKSFEEYVGAMRRLYRRAVRHDEELAQGLELRVETDFAHLADEAYALYADVLARATSVVGRVTPEFFREVAGCEAARLVTAREKSTGRLVGIELLLLGDNVLQDLYTGIAYDANERYNVYFNLIYPGIALACEGGFDRLGTGQTSYEFKSRLGVEAFPLYVYVKHRNALANALLHRFHTVICPDTPVPTHNVFRAPDTTPSKKKFAAPCTTDTP